MKQLSMSWIIIKVAFRNVFLHRLKTMIVGSILIFGSFLAVLGNSLVDAIAGGMKNSVTQSVTGDIQIFSSTAKDKLSVFGNMDGSLSDVGTVPQFSNIESHLLKIPNIKSLVPLGGNVALLNPGNLIDIEVENLRKYYRLQETEKIQSAKAYLRFLAQDLFESMKQKRGDMLFLKEKDIAEAKKDIETVLDETFWQDFDQNYEKKLEFVGNKLAPMIFDDNMLFFNYLGTDPQKFQTQFPQFEIVKGQMIPEGKKGFLIHDYIYENFVKHRIARRLDAMKKEMETNHLRIDNTKSLQDKVKANKEQLAEIYLQVHPSKMTELVSDLQVFLQSKETEIRSLLAEFLNLNDENFLKRYSYFYSKIAPHIQLYKINVGDVVPLTAMTKLGTSSAANVKIYGTFHFKSFENSPLAGNFSILDLVTFRELYGFMTESRKKQNQEIEAAMGVTDLGRDNIEAMFSGETKVLEKISPKEGTSIVNSDNDIVVRKQYNDSYSLEELKSGVFVNAAVFLKDPHLLKETIAQINTLSKAENLGIQAIDWQEASGVLGQLIFSLKIVLFFFVGVLLVVAALMIMNSLLMATMDRQQEIGTLRAIGAPKLFIYRTFLFETLVTSVLFGGIGSLLALVVIWTVGSSGIPASGDVAQFFFSGPRLFFYADYLQIALVVFAMMGISFFATQYPAWRAMRISPLQAMQRKE